VLLDPKSCGILGVRMWECCLPELEAHRGVDSSPTPTNPFLSMFEGSTGSGDIGEVAKDCMTGVVRVLP
jgi:hypothetical protein